MILYVGGMGENDCAFIWILKLNYRFKGWNGVNSTCVYAVYGNYWFYIIVNIIELMSIQNYWRFKNFIYFFIRKIVAR